MALGYPSVIGPLCEWSDAVPVEGCLAGATVEVVVAGTGRVVASGTSGGGHDLVSLVSAAVLQQGERLVVRQTLDGESSGLTPDSFAVAVGASPTSHAQLPPLAFHSRPFHCGGAVWLTGAAPGAVVTLSSAAGALGSGRADSGGNARFGLSVQLPAAGTVVEAWQEAPPGFPPLTGVAQIAAAETVALPLEGLPTPSVEKPLPIGCDASVLIGRIIDGAAVTVTRASDGWPTTATFDLDRLWFQLSKPFPKEGDRISVTQAMPRCEVKPTGPAYADIAPATPPDMPEIAAPCAGSNLVHVDRLRPGAILTVEVDGAEPLRYQMPPERTDWDVPVDALPAGKNVTVRVAVCGYETSASVAISGDPAPPAPTLGEPLYGCARAVSVQTKAGAYVELWADLGDGAIQIAPRTFARRTIATLPVSPFLTVPERVWAHQIGCGGAWLDSGKAEVKPHPRLDAVELREPFENEQAVLPLNAVSGAHITVYAASRKGGAATIIGQRDVTTADPLVGLNRRLTLDDTVWAVEEMCGQRSEGEHRYAVTPGTATFALPAPLEQSSGESPDGKLIIHSAELACRFADGAWILFADVENTEPGYDCSIVLGATVSLPAPLTFGETLDADIAAAGGLPSGLTSLGYPSRWTPKRLGTSPLLQNPAFWKEVLNATASWTKLVAWNNYAPVADKPEWVEGKNAPPDPSQPFPPLPGEDDD